MITVDHVTRTYGSFTAVDDVTFDARPGRVTGFLGPKGARKSTTLRIVVGLTPPDQGTARVLWRRFRDLPNPGREVGVLLDASAQHAGRTGREVLGIAQATMGLPRHRVADVLEVVGLNESEAGRRLRDYSLGMRQRLGLAHALLGDPEVLILDEPANGLDPAGIRWMRNLLRGYADRGATVLLSSHLLREIEASPTTWSSSATAAWSPPEPRPTCWPVPAPTSRPATRPLCPKRWMPPASSITAPTQA